ncbi:Atu4866 domain-containing protein [Streptomyces mirabilis]|uniref:Atu4866 domain-containing protein n=1 Tax=Streptomyces mirabilis TaxID=68239 RepID=UPI0036C69A86
MPTLWPAAPTLTGSPRVSVWIDRHDFPHQEPTADGRYDETRGGRPHAYQGRYWIDGDRIDYLDHLGFWAYGEFQGDALRASALPALVAVPVLARLLQRLAAPLRAVLAFAPAALTVAAGSFLGGHTVPLALALLLFVAAVAAAAPAVVETINATAPHARGAAVALYL